MNLHGYLHGPSPSQNLHAPSGTYTAPAPNTYTDTYTTYTRPDLHARGGLYKRPPRGSRPTERPFTPGANTDRPHASRLRSGPVTRTRASARKAGSAFESLVVAFLAEHVDDRIERRARNGSKDRGEVAGRRRCSTVSPETVGAPFDRHIAGRPPAAEHSARPCRAWSSARTRPGSTWPAGWLRPRSSAATMMPWRHWWCTSGTAKASAAEQLVTLRLVDLVALLTGERPELCNALHSSSSEVDR